MARDNSARSVVTQFLFLMWRLPKLGGALTTAPQSLGLGIGGIAHSHGEKGWFKGVRDGCVNGQYFFRRDE